MYMALNLQFVDGSCLYMRSSLPFCLYIDHQLCLRRVLYRIQAPPMGLSAFLDLVGINFLDHISTISRRRTIPQIGSASFSEECSKEDIIKAKAIRMEELESYRDACNLLKESTEASRAFATEQELKVIKENPQYFQELVKSDAESQLIM